MSVATNLKQVKQRIDKYLWRDHSMPLVRLRQLLKTQIMTFEGAAIVGGLARDFARKGKVGFRSDIDIVIDGSTAAVAELASMLDAVPNRFGGYAYYRPLWKIDFWALEATWAATHGYVQVTSLTMSRSAHFLIVML